MSRDDVRSAVVTGASQGIGKAIATALVKSGVKTIFASRSAKTAGNGRGQYPGNDALSASMPLDLSDVEDIARFAADLKVEQKQLNILVNCGGIYHRSDFQSSSLDHLDDLYSTNIRGTYALTQAMLPMLTQSRGDIVFVNSSIVQSSGCGAAQFAATQHALKGIADSVRAEVNERGVRVLSIYPGRTATPRQESIHKTQSMDYRPGVLLQPSDVADMVLACLNLPPTAEVTDIHIRPRNK